ncbi:hypothetical protein HDV05_003346 [Chytridiales sp. JEL 0842]|nr:hypothetical protein HDV05_003346 [Chytridiales sp. JEL 0842]
MSSQQCGKCARTVYIADKKFDAAGKWFHHTCFKCADEECNIQLSLKTFKVHENKLYCDKHVPKHKATQIADSLQLVADLNAPRQQSEGLFRNNFGNFEKPIQIADSLQLVADLNAPRQQSEGLFRNNFGNFEKPSNYGLESLAQQHALSAPRRSAENLGFVQKGDQNLLKSQTNQGGANFTSSQTLNQSENENNNQHYSNEINV